ncbi:MAG TPA: protein kinase [Longimicrobiales bacterium]|nr:protein kinase [Longimicrobiales bacterium]
MPDPIDRLNAALAGRYRVEREAGEGGMAVVYLAADLRHERRVALKVLRPEIAAIIGAERFLAEIKTTANLQHPHILPLFDSGEADGFLFYAMPFVEGETLRQRLDREHQLPVDEAVRIAENVAEALDYAHRQGVVHRDIKPANILLQDGKPVVADFGIALAVGAAGGERITETRLSLGTPLYMSPEQATGDQHLGPGTDIYALGCVLYEMLAGAPPFTGSTPQAVLGKLLTSPPPNVRGERPSVPENVDAVLRRALEKVPADRFARADHLARALTDPGFRHDTGDPKAAGSGRGLLHPVNVAALVAIVLLSATVGWQLRPSEGPREVSALELPMPSGTVVRSGSRMPVQSPDGREIVLVAPLPSAATGLWRRPLDGVSLTPIAGTEGATAPTYSPDGSALAFVVLQTPPTLRVVARDGSEARSILSGTLHPQFRDIEWGGDGWIYYTDVGGHIARIPASGGASERVTTLQEGESFHVVADVLPEGRGVLLIRGEGAPGDEEVAVAALPGGAHRPLVRGGTARYVATGHVVSGTADGTLIATPFDLDRLEAVGPSSTVLEGVATVSGGWLESLFTLSESGTLVYLPAAAMNNRAARLVWVDREGEATLVDPDHEFVPPAGDFNWSLSPDGGRVALTHASEGDTAAVWIKSLPDGPFEPLTFGEWTLTPAWTPDGRSVTYLSHDPDPTIAEGGLWQRAVDGVGEPELVIDAGARGFIWPDWSDDGSWLVFRSVNPVADLLGLRPGVDSAAVPLVASGFQHGPPDLSPDGRWLAYSSDRSGRHQVYVRSFPNVDSTRIAISVDGGWAPRWARTGDAIFYVDDAGRMITARVETEPRFRVLATEVLFRLAPDLLVPTQRTDGFFDVALDDQAFLMARWSRPDEPSRLIVMQNFTERLTSAGRD